MVAGMLKKMDIPLQQVQESDVTTGQTHKLVLFNMMDELAGKSWNCNISFVFGFWKPYIGNFLNATALQSMST